MKQLHCFGIGTIVKELESTEKFAAINELIDNVPIFKKYHYDLNELKNAVISREKIQSTGFGHGVAVAHGKVNRLKSIQIALGISHKGIDFNAVDGKPVNLLFVVANPPKMEEEYLGALSSLMDLVRQDEFRNQILQKKNAWEIQRTLKESFSDTYNERCISSHCD